MRYLNINYKIIKLNLLTIKNSRNNLYIYYYKKTKRFSIIFEKKTCEKNSSENCNR